MVRSCADPLHKLDKKNWSSVISAYDEDFHLKQEYLSSRYIAGVIASYEIKQYKHYNNESNKDQWLLWNSEKQEAVVKQRRILNPTPLEETNAEI